MFERESREKKANNQKPSECGKSVLRVSLKRIEVLFCAQTEILTRLSESQTVAKEFISVFGATCVNKLLKSV